MLISESNADASFASVLVTGSPFVRITESRQEKVKGFARAVAMRVLEFCEKTGRLPKGASKCVRAVATARPVVIADEEKQARTFLSLYQQNCADPASRVQVAIGFVRGHAACLMLNGASFTKDRG